MATPKVLNPPSQPPYLGAAYYPEDWPLSLIDEDIAQMKKVGLNCVRIAEFAWSRMEPKEGQFCFDWLHLVLEKLAAAGISTVMGTPTATPPAWLTSKHPEILYVSADGSVVTHGGRRHYDAMSPIYREYCEKIVVAMANEFGQDERIIGWQIDNELFPHHHSMHPHWANIGSSSAVSRKAFAEFMKQRYEGSIDKLNEAWCNHLWSQTYDNFEQIPYPEPAVWHHPALKTAWREFTEWSYIDFCNFQAKLLHDRVIQPVGTNMMIVFGLDFNRMNRELDIALFDHYTYREHAWQAGFWYDIMRPIKSRPYWCVETGVTWSAATSSGTYSERGYCEANSWLTIALGGEMTSYWLWRTHRAGQELVHGSILESNGRPRHAFHEVQNLSRGYAQAADFVNGTRPVNTGFAVHYSTLAFHMFSEQPITWGFNYVERLKNHIYHPLVQDQWRFDLIHPMHDLTPYKLIYSPFIPCLDEEGLRDKLKAWIEAGGTWIVGPMSDIRDLHGSKYTQAPFSVLEEWGGIYTKWEIPGDARPFSFKWEGCDEVSHGSLIHSGFELRGAKALASYQEYPFEGLAAVTEHIMGKGRVIVLGTLPSHSDLTKLIDRVAKEVGVERVAKASPSLIVVPRAADARKGIIAIEIENQPAWIQLDGVYEDLIAGGRRHMGTVQVPPYGVMVLQHVD